MVFTQNWAAAWFGMIKTTGTKKVRDNQEQATVWAGLRTVATYISVYRFFYVKAFTSSWQPNELIFYGHFLLLLSSSNGDWSCLFVFSVDFAPLHLNHFHRFSPFRFALLWASHKICSQEANVHFLQAATTVGNSCPGSGSLGKGQRCNGSQGRCN